MTVALNFGKSDGDESGGFKKRIRCTQWRKNNGVLYLGIYT